MAFLIRKFSKPKWTSLSDDPSNFDMLQADAITSCLRTSSNTLSVWEVNSNQWTDVEDILAALFSSTDNPTRTDIIILDKEKVQAETGIDIVDTLGQTPATEDINMQHKDLSNITLRSIESFARLIHTETLVQNNPAIKRFPEKEVIRIVKASLSRNKIVSSNLGERWKKHVA